MTDDAETKLKALAEEAIQAVDAEREAKARASIARRALEEAMNLAKRKEVEALGRTIRFKTEVRPNPTLKNLKVVLGEVEGQKCWDALPTKPSVSLDIPKSTDDEPLLD